MYRKIFIDFLLLTLINFLVGCYSSELVTVPEYNQMEEEDKPDDIYLTKYDGTKDHFVKNEYYIENDTLYGKGKLLLTDGEQLIDRKIALSDIESIEVEYLNGVTTTLLVLGTGAILFVGIVVVGILTGAIPFGVK